MKYFYGRKEHLKISELINKLGRFNRSVYIVKEGLFDEDVDTNWANEILVVS